MDMRIFTKLGKAQMYACVHLDMRMYTFIDGRNEGREGGKKIGRLELDRKEGRKEGKKEGRKHSRDLFWKGLSHGLHLKNTGTAVGCGC